MVSRALFSSATDEWSTPQSLVDGKVVDVQATVSLREFAGVAGAVIAVDRKELETHPG